DVRVSQARTMGKKSPANEIWGAYDAFLLAPSALSPSALPGSSSLSSALALKRVPRVDIPAYTSQVAAFRAKKPTKPLCVNFTVRFFDPYRQLDPSLYLLYIAQADIVSYDHYPVTGWNRPDRVPELQSSMAAFRALVSDKPSFVYIENADQDLDWTPKETRGANAAEIRAMAWMTVIEGATGLGWFPLAFNPFRWTNFSDEEKEATARVNREVTDLAPVILDRDAILPVRVSGPACATARRTPQGIYIFAASLDTRSAHDVTLSVEGLAGVAEVLGESRSLSVESASLSDRFDPLAVHLYLVKTP
ncbi:MAG: beta-galactosidase, partial [Planctomycetota bacterium]